METAERRNDRQRIDVNRPIELINMEGDSGANGFTRNLSTDGVRAWVDEPPELAANVLVRLSLVDGRAPVDKPGRIVWCAPDIYGEGTDVGIHLIEEGAADEPAPVPDDRPAIVPAPLLAPGQVVQIDTAGIALEARVEAIGEIDDDGAINVRLALVDEEVALPSAAPVPEADPAFDTEEWTPHPFRDAWRAARRVLGPVLTALAVVGHFAGRLLRWLWARTPRRPRARIEHLWQRLALPRRAAFVSQRGRALGRWFAHQIESWKTARGTGRSGENRV
jgi:hypothetical protein